MITTLGIIAALVALLTSLAMLNDTHLTAGERRHLLDIFHRAAIALRTVGWHGVDRDELSSALRFVLRAAALILIVPSSGVAIVMDLLGPPIGLYDALLRIGLALFMAMQAPCPWIRWITVGDRRHAPRPSVQTNVR